MGMITRPLNVRHFLYPLYGVFRFQWTKAERWAERGRFSPFIEDAGVTQPLTGSAFVNPARKWATGNH